jgi:hypothetical protein
MTPMTSGISNLIIDMEIVLFLRLKDGIYLRGILDDLIPLPS